MLLGTRIKPQYFYKLMSNRVKQYFLVNQFYSEASGSRPFLQNRPPQWQNLQRVQTISCRGNYFKKCGT